MSFAGEVQLLRYICVRRIGLFLVATFLGLGFQPSGGLLPVAWGAGPEGSGIEAFEQEDFQRAMEIWRANAAKGNRDAAFYVGYLYDTGQGVPEDNAEAASWYSKAAIQGQTSARFNLAAMFANGDGVVRDRVLAYMLFDLAADSDPDGLHERDLLVPEMTPLEVARANRLTRIARQGNMAALLKQIEKSAFSEGETPTSDNWNIWSKTDQISMTQRALSELGYQPGPADGLLGQRTKTAINAFQENQGLPVDGRISTLLLDALYSAHDARFTWDNIPYGQGRFWKIEREGEAPSYLLGTMHSNDRRILELPPSVLEIFRAADTVALELRIYSQKTYEYVSPTTYQDLMISSGRSLKEIIGRDLYSDVVTALKPVGFTEQMLNRFQPWGIYHLLTVTYNGYHPSEKEGTFLDLWLGQKAVYYRKKLVGLESAAEQIAVYSGLEEEDQVELLNSVIALADEGGPSVEEIKRLYLSGDLATILRRITQPAMRLGPQAMAKVVERLIDNRNVVMVERMEELLREGNAFVAVGAAHLPGEKGILQLLENQGYKLSKAL